MWKLWLHFGCICYQMNDECLNIGGMYIYVYIIIHPVNTLVKVNNLKSIKIICSRISDSLQYGVL